MLDPVPEADDSIADMLFSKHAGLAEVVVKPRSKLVGLPMSPGSLTGSGQLVVVAIQRNGEDVGRANMNDDAGSVGATLQAGDHLLLQGTWQALNRLASDPDILLVDSPDAVRRQAVPLGLRFHDDAGDPGSNGAGAGDRRSARSGGRADRGHGRDCHWYSHRTTGLPRDRLEHRGSGGFDDPPFDRHVPDRYCGADG